MRRKVVPFRIIGGGSLEEGSVYIAGPHGEQFFLNRYCGPSSFVFAFVQ